MRTWRDDATVGRRGDKDYWVRWTAPDGIYWFYHHTTGWVQDQGQRTQPSYPSSGEAAAELAKAPEPKWDEDREITPMEQRP